jgi:hypothetical protein
MAIRTEGIVYAGFQTLVAATELMYLKSSSDKIMNFLDSNYQNGMISFGETLHGKGTKSIKTAIRKVNRTFDYVRSNYSNNIFVDSGGYQIAVDKIEAKDVPSLIEAYAGFIDSVKDNNTYFYIEDVIPNGSKIATADIAGDLTIRGLKRFENLSKNKKENVYFIYHFQSPAVFNMWQRVLNEAPPEQILGSHRWAVGGIVASDATSFDKQFISYMIPVLDIL